MEPLLAQPQLATLRTRPSRTGPVAQEDDVRLDGDMRDVRVDRPHRPRQESRSARGLRVSGAEACAKQYQQPVAATRSTQHSEA